MKFANNEDRTCKTNAERLPLQLSDRLSIEQMPQKTPEYLLTEKATEIRESFANPEAYGALVESY